MVSDLAKSVGSVPSILKLSLISYIVINITVDIINLPFSVTNLIKMAYEQFDQMLLNVN